LKSGQKGKSPLYIVIDTSLYLIILLIDTYFNDYK